MSMPLVSPRAAWNAAGWTMLHLVWIGAVAGLAAALLRQGLQRARPEVRHGVAVAFLVALAVAPFALFAQLYRPDLETRPGVARPGHVVKADAMTADQAISLPEPRQRRSEFTATEAATTPSSLIARFEPLIDYLPGVWLSGSLATLALLATGLVGAERLRRASRALQADAIAGQCRALADALGIARCVGVAICDRIAAPVLVGIIRPMILLPPAAICGWSVDQLEMALLHELAHIRRHDNLITLLQRLTESLLFFHPVAWWLSGWVGLERELCCDRLVIARTGRPADYARMLASLAGAGLTPQTMALAMAERPLLTRIRRILDMEDRSMKMTLKEGFGLAAAAIAGTAMTLAAHARPPEKPPADAARQALEKLVQSIVAQPDNIQLLPGQAEPYDSKGESLLEIAEAQIQMGDRAGAMATIHLIDNLAAPAIPRPGAKAGLLEWMRFAVLAQSAALRRQTGDVDGARATLERASRQLEILDQGAVRGAVERVGKEIDSALTRKVEGMHRLTDEEAALISEVSAMLIQEYVELGDMVQARALIHRELKSLEPIQGTMKPVMIAVLGGFLIKAGDPKEGRELIEQARRAALALPQPETRAFALQSIAKQRVELGDLDGALALLGDVTTPRGKQRLIDEILDGISTSKRPGVWFDPAGIAIKIGGPQLSPKDPAKARTLLPRLIDAIRGTKDAKVQARTLATVAHLQARAGDVAGAMATARSIPDLKRSNFPGPSDGFYDAVKPVAFALIAAAQVEAGDKTGAAATLVEATAIARAITSDDQKLVAQIVIAQKQLECGRPDAAKAIIAEALTLALVQPEPRRSRVLTMLADVYTQAGDNPGALQTIDAIRDYPGLEKARALSGLARQHETAGDRKRSDELKRRAIACLELKAPAKPQMGKTMSGKGGFGRDTFVDFDLELNPTGVPFHREMTLDRLRVEVGDIEAAVRGARSLPAMQRDHVLSQMVGEIARHGDTARAMTVAESIALPEARVQAFLALAASTTDQTSKK